MRWMFAVLDYDNTYSNEKSESNGVQPTVYLIPEEKQIQVTECARKAQDLFFDMDETDKCIGDHFEELLNNGNIPYKEVGTLDLTFEERKVQYLADGILHLLV